MSLFSSLVPKSTNKSAYKSNLFENNLSQQQPDKWYKGDTPTVNETLGRIYSMKTTDPVGYQNAAAKLSVAQSDPSSMFYSPYIKPTNKSINELARLGYNVDNIDDDWFEQNAYLMNYYETNKTSNNVKAPTKDTKEKSEAAYYYNQILDARETTKKAQLEAKALDEEIGFWTNWSERNYSDEQVRGKVRNNFASKYPTLQKMLDSAKSGEPINLNSAVPYATDDWIDGRTWAWRNDGGYEKDYKNQAMAGLGKGNLWQEDQEITDRLNPKNEKYSPYTVSSTLDDACAYYGVNGFQNGWLEANKPDGTDPVENSMYNKVFEAEKFTQQAEDELGEFNKWLNNKLVDAKDPENIMKSVKNRIEMGFYPALKEMNDSLQKVDNLKGTTRAIDFSLYDIRQQVETTCARNSGKLTGDETIEANGGMPLTQQTAENIKNADNRIRGALDMFEEDMTDMELSMFRNAGSSAFNSVMKGLKDIPTGALLEKTIGKVASRYVTDTVPLFSAAKKYNDNKELLDNLNLNNQIALQTDPTYAKLEAIKTADPANMTEEEKAEYDQVKNWFSDFRNSQLTKQQRMSAVESLYEYFTGEDLKEILYEYDDISESVRGWANYLEDQSGTKWALSDYAAGKRDEYESIMAQNEWAIKELEGQEAILDARIDMYKKNGYDTTELETAKAVSSYLTEFSEKEAKVWQGFNYYEQMMMGENAGATYAEVAEAAAMGNEQFQTELKRLQQAKEYIEENKIQLPDDVVANMAQKESILNDMVTDYKYFTMRGEDDFDEMVAKGRELEAKEKTPLPEGWAVTSNWMVYDDSELADWGLDNLDGANLMEPVEKDTWYYLYAKYGKEAAIDYYKHLYEKSLPTRSQDKLREDTKQEVNSGFGGALKANAISIVAGPLGTLANVIYLAKSLIEGEFDPSSPLLNYNIYSSTVNETTANSIKSGLGDGVVGTMALGLYEIIYNRAQSAMNAVAFGDLGNMFSGRFSSMLNEFAGASPMAIRSATDAIANATRNNADVGQAWLMGLITFIGEDISEGLTYGNIKEVINGGEDAVISSVKDAVVNWLTKSGVEEAIGEVGNNAFTNLMGEAIMGENSDRNRQIDELTKELMEKNPGMLLEDARKQAEDTVYREEYLDYLHTGIISYLSAGLDVPAFAIQQMFNNIRTKNQAEQKKTTDFDAAMSNYNSLLRAREAMGSTVETTMEEAQQLVSPNPILSDADKELIDALSRLDAVADSDVSTQTAAIVDLFGEEENTPGMDMAKAAAVNMAEVFGSQENAVKAVSDLVMQARIARVRVDLVLEAVKTAALSPSSEARKAVGLSADATTSDGVSLAPSDKVIVLAGTVSADTVNEVVQAEIAKATTESRVAEAEKDIIAANPGAVDTVTSFSQIFEKAEKTLQEARDAVKARRDERQAKSEALIAAAQAFADNPTTENKNAQTKALGELDKAITVEGEYKQHLEKAQADYDTAWDKLQAARGAALTDVRQQAEQIVADQNTQRAEIAAQQAAAAQDAAQKAAKIQEEIDIKTGKKAEDDTRRLAEDWANIQHLEGDDRDAFIQRVMDRREQMTLGKVDMTGKVSNAEGVLVLDSLERKLGITIKKSYDLPDDARGKYADGVVYLNGKLIEEGNMTVGQALVEASLHEITHAMESTKSYEKYSNIALESLFGKNYFTSEAFQAAIAQKKTDYRNSIGQELTDTEAQREIVADFARTKLNDKPVVQRFVDDGLGGKIRNTLHNINQAIKNFRLTGDEKRQAEYMRKAEATFQKALNELARTSIHPTGEQFSISQFAQAAGLRFDDTDLTLRDSKGNVIDGINTHVTPEMLKGTPVGKLIDSGVRLGTIAADKSEKVKEQFAQLMDMCAKYRNSDMIWEIAASTLESEFSAIKSNSDKQYSTTVDFGTICAKTQAIVDQLSRNMLKAGRGLTVKEILAVYNDVYESDLTVPCPVCYVFSRWMGVPSLLNSMKNYQDRFLGPVGDQFTKEKTQELVDQYVANAQEKYGIDKDFGKRVADNKKALQEKIDSLKAKIGVYETNVETKRTQLEEAMRLGKPTKQKQTQLNSAIKTLNEAELKLSDYQVDYENAEVNAYGKAINAVKAKLDQDVKKALDKIDGGDTGRGLIHQIADAKRMKLDTTKLEKQLDALYAKVDELNAQRAEVDGYNWVTQALCYLDDNGRFVVDGAFTRTKDEVLFDLNRTAEFAKDAKNWKYRTTRGAGMGKAILPYSGASIGDSVYGVSARNVVNSFLAYEDNPLANDKALANAMKRARQQNLIGGQRFQSTSDFRAEWGLDYIMTFIEQQAIGSTGQLYTKVAEAVPLFAKAGIDTNISVMPFGDGWHLNKKGEVELDFSSVTGMDYKLAKSLKDQYDNVQMILVGINDTHILAALRDADIDFVIPWHSSGNSRGQLASMMASVKEQLNESSDYTKLQSDVKYEGETSLVEKIKAKIKEGAELSAAEQAALRRDLNRTVREKILTGGFAHPNDSKGSKKKAPTRIEMEAIRGSQYLSSLYHRFYEDETSDCYGVQMTSSQASQIFPYEYWQTDVKKIGGTKATADENGRRFCEYCTELGYIPRFSGRAVEITNEDGTKETVNYGNFSGMNIDEKTGAITFNPVPGYWKLLIDRSMYDLNGNYRSQQKIDVTNISQGNLLQGDDGKFHLTDSDLRRTDINQQNRAQYRLDDERVLNAHRKASQRFDERMGLQSGPYDVRYYFSVYDTNEMTDADIDQMLYRLNGEGTPATIAKTDADIELDTEYFNAVNSGDMETAQKMVNQRAKELKAEVFAATDVPAYKIRRGYQPKKTIKVYKTFTLDDDGNPSALFVSSKNPIPVGVWLDAQDTFHFTSTKNGRMYVPSTKNPNTKGGATGTPINLSDISESDLAELERLGHIKRNENGEWSAKSLTSLAYRPGWHAGDMPFFPQGGMKIEGSNYENVHRYNQVVFECEMAADQDYTSYDIREDGTIAYHDRQEMPADGSYKFATNPMANAQDIGAWYISGALKINRALTEEECNRILAENGRAPQEWQRYQDPNEMKAVKGKQERYQYEHSMGPLDLDALGYDPTKTDGGKKLLDPVTYDDDGNIIPLSERFNKAIQDPRYSIDGELTDADIDARLAEAGLIPGEGENAEPQTSGPSVPSGNLPEEPGGEGTNMPRIGQRQFGHQTAQGSDALHQEVKDYLYKHSSYTPDSNQEQIDRAIGWVQSKATADDPDGFYAALNEVESPDFDYRSADGQARMLTVMGMAALRDDRSAELRLADAFNKQGTDLGRQLQARKMFRLMTPVGRKSVLQSMAKQVNEEFAKRGSNTRLVIPELLLDAAGMAETEGDFEKVQKRTAKLLAEQIPANWKEKLTGWRMLAMLGNPRTHIRNILGNFMFMPMVGIKNKVGAVAELGMKAGNRTKTIGFATSDARAFAKKDALTIKDVLTGDAKYNDGDLIQQNRKTWGTGKSLISRTLGKALQAVSDFNGRALEAEDWIFLNRHYRNALAGYMTANKLTSADMTGETLEKARTYAVQEAQKATYRDFNKLASDLSAIARKGGVTGFVVNAVLPFKKTPANILKRGVEYSPVGIMKALTADAYHLRQYMDYQRGKLKALPEKAISPNQWIDKMASGLTGTAVLALGGLLSSIGAVRAGFDDDDPEDQYAKERGEQEYALNPGKAINRLLGMGILGEDVTMTIDWTAPMSMPLFVGAAMFETVRKLNEGKNVDVLKLAESVLDITEPVFNLSMLDGVNSLLDVNNYGEGNAITQIGEKVLTNYATSYVPTLFGQAARTIDTVRRKSYVESGAAFSTELYAWEKVENKIPFLSKSNIPYRNVWGDTSEKETLAAGLENFLSPAYWNTIQDDVVIDELQRLYESTIQEDKKSALKLKMPGKTVSGKKLDAEKYDTLTVERGQTAKNLLTELMGSPEYEVADDTTRAEMISDVWTFSNQRANNIVAGTDMDSWVRASLDGDPVKAVINRAITRNMNAQKTGYKKALENALVSGNLEDAQTAIAGLRRAGKSDSNIKADVTNTLKPLYQKAFLNDDFNAMNEIEDILDNLDEDIVWKYVDWVTKLNQEEEPEGEKEEESVNINWLNRNYR